MQLRVDLVVDANSSVRVVWLPTPIGWRSRVEEQRSVVLFRVGAMAVTKYPEIVLAGEFELGRLQCRQAAEPVSVDHRRAKTPKLKLAFHWQPQTQSVDIVIAEDCPQWAD